MTQGTGRGVVTSLTKGLGSSYSVMMPCPWVPAFIKSRPSDKLDIGLEVTLTSPLDLYRWGPLAGKPAVPGLVDPEGCFWKAIPQLLQKATADEVETEIRAQWDRAVGFGLKLTHMDSSDGVVFAKADFLERYLKISKEKGVPVIFAGGHMTYLTEENKTMAEAMKSRAVDVWNAGFPLVDDIVMQVANWETGQKKAKMEALLHGLKPGITHVYFQPAVPTDDLRMIMTTSGSRIQDNMILTDFSIRRVIENRKIIVTDWRELMERRKKAAPIEK